MVKLDAVLMEQVLVNLLDNAAKYAPGGIDHHARTPREADGRARHRDHRRGAGHSRGGDWSAVFDKFYRVRQGDRQRAGTGLGLAICRGFVEALGGTDHGRTTAPTAPAPSSRITFPAALTAQASSAGRSRP